MTEEEKYMDAVRKHRDRGFITHLKVATDLTDEQIADKYTEYKKKAAARERTWTELQNIIVGK